MAELFCENPKCRFHVEMKNSHQQYLTQAKLYNPMTNVGMAPLGEKELTVSVSNHTMEDTRQRHMVQVAQGGMLLKVHFCDVCFEVVSLMEGW